MKLGKILTRGLGAAMVGYGKTLTDQDAREQKQRELDGVLWREQALSTFNHQNQLDTIDATAAANVAQTEAIEKIKTREEGLRLGPVTDAKIRADQARIKAEADAEYQNLDAKTKATISIEQYRQNRLDTRAKLDREARATEGDKDRQVRLDTSPVAEAEGLDGTPVIAYGPGATTRLQKLEGGRWKRGRGSDDDSGTTLQGARGGGRAQPAPAAAPVDKAASLAADKAMLAQVYPNATPQTYPGFFDARGKKLSLAELSKQLEDYPE